MLRRAVRGGFDYGQELPAPCGWNCEATLRPDLEYPTAMRSCADLNLPRAAGSGSLRPDYVLRRCGTQALARSAGVARSRSTTT